MEPAFIIPIAIVGIISARKLFTTWIHAKHGYPPEDAGERIGRKMRRIHGGMAFTARDDGIDDARKIMLLTNENEKLTGKVGRLEERLAVLERIATDPAERTAREIDALR